jgi:O-antigen/teichoic acid export membrane protein
VAGVGVARNAFYLVLGQVATTVLAIAMSAALGRSLGAEDFGRYYLINTMAVFAYVFVEWGQAFYVIREAARAPAGSGLLLGTSLFNRVAFAVASTLPVGLVAWALGYGAATTWLCVALILAMVPQSLALAYGMVFRAHERMGKDAAVSVVNKAVAVALVLPALAAHGGIPGVVAALGAAGVLSLLLAARYYRGLGLPRLQFTTATSRQMLVACAPIVAMTAAVSVQPYLDAIILAKLVPVTVVGWFGAARGILGTLMAPAGILGAAAYPRIARASSDPAALRREVRTALRPLLWLAALGGTGTYLFASTAIRLIYGKGGFEPAATVLEVFAPGLFLLFIDILLGNVIYASGGGTTAFAVGKILSVAVATALDLALIPWFQLHHGNGGIGVVVAFALSELVVFAGAMVALPKGTLTAAALLDVARALGCAAVTLGLFLLLPGLPPWVGIPLCVLVFTAASLLLRLASPQDLGALLAAVRSRG